MGENGENPLVAQFKEVCAVPDDVAVQFLQFHGWNLEEALHTYFRNDGILPENGHAELRRRGVDSPSTSNSSTDEVNFEQARRFSTSDLGSSSEDDDELAKAEGDHDIESVLYPMQTAIDENIGHFNTLREARLQRDIDSRLRREQELEYERALAADRAKETERKRVESERLEAERREQEEREALINKKERLQRMKAKIQSSLPEEPSSTEECIRVNIRFPSGEKMERRFCPNDSLELLFNVTLSHESCPDDFSLLTSYPRKQLHCSPSWYREYASGDLDDSPISTFAEAGFPKASVVLVQDNEA
ncbi:hypothetical protein QR680_017562 [Steinernema hermaphroditum]|uniref:UBX domain-containing protein n=1 Tax=Steinernema hermaphroditum TaxID=289476 RepID=A0AA39HHF8_9BILA|nr:hypothetical protein QR680_017562 [Steinernema hermaphroditum]